MNPKAMLVLALATLPLVGCGDKVPESETAKQIGAAPKQTVDKAAADVTKALDQGAQRDKQADDANK
jgi:hypothetical protein